MTTENQIEKKLIAKLTDLKYTYRQDIRDKAALEQNFRQKFQSLNRVSLTDAEFARLRDEIITADVFTAAQALREKGKFSREDGTPLEYMLVNLRDWCKNEFEVINQLRINTENSHHRYDVILLINGLPLVQIELKTLQISPRRAMEQIVDYKNDPGNGYKHLASGDVPVYGSGGYMLSVDDYLYDGESVCIGRKGTIDNPIFLTGKFWTVDTLFYTHSFRDCLPRFIYAIFQQINWVNHNEAGGIPSLSKTNIGKIKVAVPKPCEQQKISDCLTSVDELITTQTQKLDTLKTHKKGLMQQLFPAEGETVPRLRFPEFRDKGEWVTEELGSKTKKVGSGITPTGGDKNYKAAGRPFVRSQNVSWGSLILNDVAYIDEETHSSFSATEIQKDDVLLNITGASIGRSSVANHLIEGGNVNQHVCIIRTKKKELNPFFLNQFLISQFGQNQIGSFQAGGNRQGLNFAQIRSFSIPMPPAIEEQQKIVGCLTSIDELISNQAKKIEALKAHKKGLMQQLFPAMEEVTV
jgi:type I restriction enzyme S subunit